MRRRASIVVASLAWTLWHAGYLFELHHFGIGAAILTIFVVQIFLVGIVLNSFFALGRYSLLPCVLLHAALNASAAVYFGRYSRANDLGSYVAQVVFTLIVAVVAFRMALRGGENNFWLPEQPATGSDPAGGPPYVRRG
jgi:hypothetical protein